MSWELVSLVKSRVVGSSAEKAVLEAMAHRANDDGSDVFISKKRIAAETELSRTTVVAACDRLLKAREGRDALIEEVGRRSGRRGYTVAYKIRVAAVRGLAMAWDKCSNLDTLDDALIEGDEPVSKPRKSRRKVSSSEQNGRAIVFNRGADSVQPLNTETSLPETSSSRARDSVHRRADPDYANDRPSQPSPEDAETLRLEKKLIALRRHLATAAKGEEIEAGDYAGMLPTLAARAIREEIADLENRLAQKRIGA